MWRPREEALAVKCFKKLEFAQMKCGLEKGPDVGPDVLGEGTPRRAHPALP